MAEFTQEDVAAMADLLASRRGLSYQDQDAAAAMLAQYAAFLGAMRSALLNFADLEGPGKTFDNRISGDRSEF